MNHTTPTMTKVLSMHERSREKGDLYLEVVIIVTCEPCGMGVFIKVADM